VRYWLLAGVTTASAFALAAMAASAVLCVAAGRVSRSLERRTPAARARILYRIRILPAAAAALSAFAVALPIFLWFEDRGTDEPVARTLMAVAAAGCVLMARGAWRLARAWRATSRIARGWQRQGRRIDGLHPILPVYAVDESFPVVAVVGVFHPVLFVAESVLRECSEGEVRAMIAHECAHVTAGDNLKRFVIRACPDVFGTPRVLDREWTAAAEEAADARAAAADPGFGLELARALIRVARLAPVTGLELASAFYRGGSIEARVRRLVDPPAERELSNALGCVMMWGVAAIVAAAVIFSAPALHQFMERAVRLLP
jgi:hypothetical protein